MPYRFVRYILRLPEAKRGPGKEITRSESPARCEDLIEPIEESGYQQSTPARPSLENATRRQIVLP